MHSDEWVEPISGDNDYSVCVALLHPSSFIIIDEEKSMIFDPSDRVGLKGRRAVRFCF